MDDENFLTYQKKIFMFKLKKLTSSFWTSLLALSARSQADSLLVGSQSHCVPHSVLIEYVSFGHYARK